MDAGMSDTAAHRLSNDRKISDIVVLSDAEIGDIIFTDTSERENATNPYFQKFHRDLINYAFLGEDYDFPWISKEHPCLPENGVRFMADLSRYTDLSGNTVPVFPEETSFFTNLRSHKEITFGDEQGVFNWITLGSESFTGACREVHFGKVWEFEMWGGEANRARVEKIIKAAGLPRSEAQGSIEVVSGIFIPLKYSNRQRDKMGASLRDLCRFLSYYPC